MKGYINSKNRSTFCEIKYMNRLGFFKGLVYGWGGFKILTPKPIPNYPKSNTHTHTITEDMKGYINSKDSI